MSANKKTVSVLRSHRQLTPRRGSEGRGSGGEGQGATLRERIRLLIELGRPKEAVALCHRARAAGDEGPELMELIGLAEVRLGDFEAALRTLGHALQTSPERAHLHYLLAFAARSAKRDDEARAALAQALRLAPDEPVYLRALAELQSDTQEHEAAVLTAKEAVRCGPDRAANHVTLGFVSSAAGDKALARASYEQALALDPEDAAAWNNLGCLDLEAGDAVTARERFRHALRLQPSGERAQRNLAQTLKGRTLSDLTTYERWLAALAEELAQLGETRMLIALAVEADAARDVFWATLRKPGRVRNVALVSGISVWTLLRIARLGGIGALVGAGTGVLASFAAKQWLTAERDRVRALLREARNAHDVVRSDWLSGRIEREARDAAARLLVERVTLALCRRGDSLRPHREGFSG